MFEATGKVDGVMTFLTRVGSRTNQARALDAWRDAALVVRLRWDVFRVADSESRPAAFAAYVAALDAEADAAGELAYAHSHLAEAA